ncbi:LysR family transcriptional regulator [Actinomadura graeca]|uniref:LysR family transcriptional regulator n=1 Tax=Actinomadura graeca TaxID=2750812 RepID=A0ABX8R3N9_9ACTN|nr:LysR family transcriptional regulator [Actinomadura graeca]QXJ25665.1 LysR family transcriptional regulator [Actinomadura graeca]
MDLELRHLHTVCAIAETGSLTKAAAAMHISQPALTARLKQIEGELGAALFDRSSRGMLPTPVGELVLLQARAILHGVAGLRGSVTRSRQSGGASISLGGVCRGHLAIGLAERLGDHLDGADVRLTLHYSPSLLWDLVGAGRFDLATTVDYRGYELRPSAEVRCATIVREPIFLALPAADPLARLSEVPLGDLADRTWIMGPPDGAGWPDCFIATCGQAGFEPRVRYITPSPDSVRALVAAGRGVAACQAACGPAPGLAIRPIAGRPLTLRHVLLSPRDGRLADRMTTMLELARAAYWSHIRDQTDFYHLLRTEPSIAHGA